MTYQPDPIRHLLDPAVISASGPEPSFGPEMRSFLLAEHRELRERLFGSQVVEWASFGPTVPWVYRFIFRTRSLTKSQTGEIGPREEHLIAFRLMPDYLRKPNRFESLLYVGPTEPAPFHPNIDPLRGAICLELYPGEPVVEVVQSLHDLLRWRIRELREGHALNHEACRYGRANVPAPLDDRPLVPRRGRMEILPS